MIDSGCEVDLGRLERVVGWEVYGKEEHAALEWTVALCYGILISHLFLCTDPSALSGGERVEAHTGPMIVACQWN